MRTTLALVVLSLVLGQVLAAPHATVVLKRLAQSGVAGDKGAPRPPASAALRRAKHHRVGATATARLDPARAATQEGAAAAAPAVPVRVAYAPASAPRAPIALLHLAPKLPPPRPARPA